MIFLTGDAAGSEKEGGSHGAVTLLRCEMCSLCSALELAPGLCVHRGSCWLCLLGWAGLCCLVAPGSARAGLCHSVPSLPHELELCLGAWGRRRSLDMSETGQIMELSLSGAPAALQVPL